MEQEQLFDFPAEDAFAGRPAGRVELALCDATAAADDEGGRRAGAVARADDERRRQQAFEFGADAGVGQFVVFGWLAVVEQVKRLSISARLLPLPAIQSCIRRTARIDFGQGVSSRPLDKA